MESIIENVIRNGNLTSSHAFELCSNAKKEGELSAVALKYIAKKNIERKLGRSTDLGKGTNSTRWGSFLEQRVHNILGLDYELIGHISVAHPKIPYWVGSPDLKNDNENVIADIKCFEPENFANYIDVLIQNDLGLFKSEYPKEYWQLISNACIYDKKFIEAIVYMPYESELPEIREMSTNYDGVDQWKYRFISELPASELAYLPDGNKFYKNLNIFRFEAPVADKDFLQNKVLDAGTKLIAIN